MIKLGVNVSFLFLILLINPDILPVHGYFITYELSIFKIFNFRFVPSAKIGAKFGRKEKYTADLVFLPEDNMSLCNSSMSFTTGSKDVSSGGDGGRRIKEDGVLENDSKWSKYMSFNDTDRELVQKQPIDYALLVTNGDCSIEAQALNAVKINRIKFLVVVSDTNNIEELDKTGDGETTSSASMIDLRIAYLTKDVGADLLGTFYGHIDDDWEPFLHASHNIYRPYTPFRIYFGEKRVSVSLLWIKTLYLFLVFIATIPILRFLTLLISRGLRYRRDEMGRITGVTWNRPDGVMFQDGRRLREGLWSVLDNIESRIILGKVTEEEVNGLPRIRYNVSDIEEVASRYEDEIAGKVGESDRKADVSPTLNDLKPPPNPHPDINNVNFLQNAYASFTSCSICIEEFTHAETLVLLPHCGHFFHPNCIVPWLTNKKSTCPLCQTIVVARQARIEGVEDSLGTSASRVTVAIEGGRLDGVEEREGSDRGNNIAEA